MATSFRNWKRLHNWEAPYLQVYPGGTVVKNLPAKAEDSGPIPESGIAPEEGMATHSSVLTWEILRKVDPSWLQSMGSQTVGHD